MSMLRFGDDPWFLFFIVCLSFGAFYTAHWQTYVTGSLRFGKIDVTEAQCVIYGMFALTALLGDSFWFYRVPVLKFQLRYVLAMVGIMGFVVSIFSNLSIIAKGGKGKNGSSVAVSI